MDNWYKVEIRQLGFLSWEWRTTGVYNGESFFDHSVAFTRWGAIYQGKSTWKRFLGKNALWAIVVYEQIPKPSGS